MKIFFSGIEELINEDGNPTSTGLAQAQTVFEKVKQRKVLSDSVMVPLPLTLEKIRGNGEAPASS